MANVLEDIARQAITALEAAQTQINNLNTRIKGLEKAAALRKASQDINASTIKEAAEQLNFGRLYGAQQNVPKLSAVEAAYKVLHRQG